MEQNGVETEISVIIPVYNVADYLDVCMESIVAQTYTDMEILLINDGSTDSSADRCREWQQKDERIRFVDKANEGVAATRNLGVQLTKGKYIAFVDPDDWLERDYMEKLHSRLEETGADFAECDLWRYDNRSGKKIYRSCYGRMGESYTLREHMKYGPTATYKSMFRRTLWTKYDIRMPECAFESPAIYALLVALSGQVESIREPLYYYRRFRENSLIENGYAAKDGSPNNTLGVEAMEFLMHEFRRCGIYDTYKATLEGVVKYRLNDILAMQFHRKSTKDFRELVQNYRDFLRNTFPKGHNACYITWGGYNLNRILTHMNWLHDPYCRFNFSSLIAVCGQGEEDNTEPFRHKNRYRQIMLERERERSIWQIIDEIRPRYFFMDLIEERFDLILTGGRYLTKSDAYDGSGRMENVTVIERNSTACTELWKQCATEFLDKLQKAVPGIQIVLIENYLSETCGDLQDRWEFPEIASIRNKNALLSEYYAFIEDTCPNAIVIRPANDSLYFTDRKYEYGAIPSHLNEIVNQRIAEEIERELLGEHV